MTLLRLVTWLPQEHMPIGEEVLVKLPDGYVGVGWLQGDGMVYVHGSVKPRTDVTGWMPLTDIGSVFDLLHELNKALEFARTRERTPWAYEYLFGKKSNPRKHAVLEMLEKLVGTNEREDD